jgi:RimJ/RimL family protein N-acetyltransferase
MLSIWNDPAFIHFVGDRGVRSADEARTALESGAMAMYEKYGYGPFGIRLRDSEEVLGICGLFRRDYLEDPDIGFALLPDYRGQGYAGEAAIAVADYAKNELALPRLTALVSARNAASIGLILKLGMRFERAITVQAEAEPVQLYVIDWNSAPTGGAGREN